MPILKLLKGAGVSLGALGMLLAGAGAGSTAPTPAVLAGGQAGVVCAEDPHGHERRSGRRGEDHAPVDAAVARRVNAQLRAAERELAPAGPHHSSSRLASPIVVDVYVHNVYGSHRGERDLGSPAVRVGIDALRRHFAGFETANSVATRFRFRLMSIHVIRSDRFYHAAPNSSADKYYKRQYHRGGRDDLNIYLNEASDGSGGELLGWAKFPWEAGTQPRLDGVNVHPESLPNRKLAPYNQGDTLTHEVGHWLGLMHAFEGGCQDLDGVRDTTAQRALSGCPAHSDTCTGRAGADQPWNYMQYTFDACMRSFSPWQSLRMSAAWTKWRR